MSPRPACLMFTVVVALAVVVPVSSQTRPAEEPILDTLIARLEGSDAAARRLAGARIKNLAGSYAEAVEKAARREGLSDEAAAALQDALPPLRYRARAEALAVRASENDVTSALEAYAQVSKKDPKWDAAAREALGLRQAGPAAVPRAQVIAAFKKAIDAGCDDPLVAYLHARAEWLERSADRDAVAERHLAAALALAATKYPAEWKCRAAARYIEQTGARNMKLMDVCIEYLPLALAETRRGKEEVSALVDLVWNILSQRDDAAELFERIHAAYLKARPEDPGPYVLKGNQHINYGWQARGGGYANTVSPQAWKVFSRHLSVAREQLEKAWQLDPDAARAPTLMIKLVMGEGGDRDEMETWFRRAMEANPDNTDACSAKLYYLYPRWHGSHAEMVAFGRECLATQNWWAAVPLTLVGAHEHIATEVPDRGAYLSDPSVWGDIESVYRSFLDVLPDSRRAGWYRSKLAKWACDCQQWDAAVKVFAEIGDKPDMTVFRSPAVYNYYRKKAERKATGVQQASVD